MDTYYSTSVFEQVAHHWKLNQISLVTPLAADELRNRFKAEGLDVAEDLVRFLATAGGMTDHEWDNDGMWSFWNGQKIIEEAQANMRHGVWVADWLINSHFHLLRKESDIVSSVWVDFCKDEPLKVADTLEDFLQRYLLRDSSTFVLFGDDTVPDIKRGTI